jgi:hypothetical protein
MPLDRVNRERAGMPTLKTANGTIEVGNGRIVRQAERMGKLSEPRRAHRLEKAKALLAKTMEAGAGAKPGKGGKGKKTEAAAKGFSPAAKQAAAILLGQGIAEL